MLSWGSRLYKAPRDNCIGKRYKNKLTLIELNVYRLVYTVKHVYRVQSMYVCMYARSQLLSIKAAGSGPKSPVTLLGGEELEQGM